MVNAVCFCPACKTGYKKDVAANKLSGKRNPTLFAVPKDPQLFQLWQKAIPRADRLLRPTDFVCEKHFKKEDVRYHQTPIKLFDGSVYIHMLSIPRLRKSAIPCIFADVPGHSTYIPKIKRIETGGGQSDSKRKCVITNLIAPKAVNNYSETETTEARKECFSSKEKENVLRTDFSFLPPIILNCLTNEPKEALETLNKININEFQSLHNKSISKDTISRESPVCPLQGQAENNALKENDVSCKQSKLNSHVLSKSLDEVSTLSPNKNSSTNIEVISFQSNSKNIFSGSQASFQSSEAAKTFSTNCQEIVLVTESQSNLTYSEASHRPSNTSISKLNPPNDLTTGYFVNLQPSDTQNTIANLEYPYENCSEPQGSRTCPVDSAVGEDSTESKTKNNCSFEFLKSNVLNVIKINSWWTVNALDDFIICARWNSECLVERKIVIYRDFKVKVFLKEKETMIGNDLEATSVEFISKLIYRVERLRICPNILKGEGNCYGFLQANFRCKQKNMCFNCIKRENDKLKKERLEKSREYVELFQIERFK